jgi:hypothetical protein
MLKMGWLLRSRFPIVLTVQDSIINGFGGGSHMEKNTENQILDELKNINYSLQYMNKRIDTFDSGGKRPFILWDILRSMLIGVFIVGPAIVVVIIILQIVGTWLFH